MGNTVGRLSKVDSTKFAYIAGFLDGDGSIMLQLHKREGSTNTYRVKTVICFYQDSSHHQELEWFKKVLNCGYLYQRNDHISELRIEGFQRVFEVLSLLKPFLRFKRNQANLMLELIPKLQNKTVLKADIAIWISKMRSYNYISHQRNTLVDVPVTT